MTDHHAALAKIHAACWKGDAVKARFIADPKAVLAERGIDVPDRIEVGGVESGNHGVHVTGV
ncbi:MAG: hypothetical protein RLZZ461_887 [Planctomycetota bacterium]|jgi:hypothetical protein